MTSWFSGLRRSLWHLRQGGVAQFMEHRRRLHSGLVRGRLFDARTGDLLPYDWPSLPPRRDLCAGVIADDFTRAAFSYEWHTVELKPSTWRDQLDDIQLLFVESAWHGNHDAWQYQLTGSKAPSAEVVALVEECRRRGIPSVFWNKEDPTHFEDFLASAALFDHVFTTDENRVDDYRERLGHDRVGVLPFAVQERVTNPVRRFQGEKTRDIAFAGTWFAHKYPERREQMRLLFDAALATDAGFDIYSRFLGGDERYQFPEPYASHVVGSLSYDQMLSAYRAYRVFLNVNTVTDSPTMFARRLLEITACGTPVVTTPTPAIAHFLGDGVAQVATPDEAERALRELLTDPEHAAAMVQRGQRELWARHTYAHRVDDILDAVGLPGKRLPIPEVSVIMATKRPQQLQHALEQVGRQAEVRVQWLLGTHGFEVPDEIRAQAVERGIDLTVVPAGEDLALGDVLNLLLERADCAVVSKMDDDDVYGPRYLGDLLAAKRISGADVVGKQERWVHLKALDRSVLVSPGMAWRPTTFVAGPTITADRDLARELRFPSLSRSEDTGFLARLLEAGGEIVATDPFQFVQWRAGTDGGHSWDVADDHFLRAERQIDGLPPALSA